MNLSTSNGVTRERRQYQLIRWAVMLAGTLSLGLLIWVSSAQAVRVLPYLRGETLDCGCQVLNLRLSPLALGLSIGVVMLTVSMLMRGLWRFGRRGWSDWKLNSFVRAHGRPILHAPTGLTFWLLPDNSRRAMTIGLRRPRVVVTSGLVQYLTKSELTSVLRHEQAHQRAHDPIWSALIEALGAAWWWAPALKSWVNATYRLRELAADETASQATTDRTSLGAAVLKLLQAEPGPVSAFSPNRDRVEKLLNPAWRPQLGLWRWSTVMSLGFVLTGLVLLVRWQAVTAATIPVVPAQLCQEVITACRQAVQTQNTAGPVLCVDQGGWRCLWVTGSRMTPNELFSK